MKSIEAGAQFTLALREDGTVWSWGSNGYGELGRLTPSMASPTPQQVPGLSGVVSVAAGGNHSLALREDGTVWSWGSNWYGELGRLTPSMASPTPQQVPGLSGVVALAAGGNHSLALLADGTVWAWGSNDNSELGRPATPFGNSTPQQVPGISDVVALSTSISHVLALRADGTVWAWGNNSTGQLGRPASFPPEPAPMPIPGLTNVAELGAGSGYSLALSEDGTVWAWGNNSTGQLADGTRTARSTPRKVDGVKHVIALDASFHALVMSREGTVWGWGYDTAGQLATGTDFRVTPVRVTGLTGVVAVATATQRALALRADGTLWTWGSGPLGNGVMTDRQAAPVPVQGLSNVTAMSASINHSMALCADGTVWVWGSNAYGQLGSGTRFTNSTTPKQVPGLSGVVAIQAGQEYSLALREDGTVWAWGSNGYGQLGQPANSDANITPRPVPGLTGVVAISTSKSSGSYTLALREDGTVWSWGYTGTGLVGVPSSSVADPIPRQVPALTGVVSISAGQSHALALREDGGVWLWREILRADGTMERRFTPAPVPGLTNVKGIAAGDLAYSLVWLGDGTVWGFGSNTYRMLSNEEQDFHSTPVQRPGLSGVAGLAASQMFALALLDDGTVRAWGTNFNDQMGDGVSSIHDTPVRMPLPCRFTGMPSSEHRAPGTEHCPAAP